MNQQTLYIETVISYLNSKGVLTDLDRDILSSIDTYNENPFDRITFIRKIKENYIKYPELCLNNSILNPGESLKPLEKVNDTDLIYNLYMQIEKLCIKDGLSAVHVE